MNIFKQLKTIWNCRKELFLDLKIKVDLIAFQKEWRRLNSHNSTIAGCKFDLNKVEVGDSTYGTLNIHCWDNPDEHIKIGNYCSIAENVHLLLGGMHPINKITTYPYRGGVLKMTNTGCTLSKGAIIIEDDVWLCYGATVLSGVTIGKGSIVAANSIVTKNIPPYSIVINGEVKRKRFSNFVINKLIEVDLGKIKELKDIQKANEILETDITDDNIDYILAELSC